MYEYVIGQSLELGDPCFTIWCDENRFRCVKRFSFQECLYGKNVSIPGICGFRCHVCEWKGKTYKEGMVVYNISEGFVVKPSFSHSQSTVLYYFQLQFEFRFMVISSEYY